MKIALDNGGSYLEPDDGPRNTKFHMRIVRVEQIAGTRSGHQLFLECGHGVQAFGNLGHAKGGRALHQVPRPGGTMKPPSELESWLAEVGEALRRDMLPKMKSSRFVMGIITPESDPWLLMQIGAAVLLEKPLVLIVLRGAWVPAKARQLADIVIEVASADAPADRAKIQAGIRELMEKLDREKRAV